MACGLRGVVASSARISVEAGRPGWHAARAWDNTQRGLAPAACLRVERQTGITRSEGRRVHFENGMPGRVCSCSESRPRERAQPGGRKRSYLGASGGHGWPRRASGDGARASPTHQRTLHPPLHTPTSIRRRGTGKPDPPTDVASAPSYANEHPATEDGGKCPSFFGRAGGRATRESVSYSVDHVTQPLICLFE